MPSRLIKDSIHTSDKVSAMTDFQFRLWIGLITQADDAGRGDARPAIIKGRVFPLRKQVSVKDIERALNELERKGCISISAIADEPKYRIADWEKMQPDAGRRTSEYRAWRKAVFERDGYTCQNCGKRGGTLHAHHISRYETDISGRTDVNNGVTLCDKCHKAVHKKEGR